jgi:glycosyltransferase involved in cell wall biosynthesis
LAQAKRLIALNEGERELFKSLLRFSPERFVVIPNGGDRLVIEDEEISPAADRPNPHLIVSVGRLERFKGHHRLVAALPLIRERYPDLRLAIVGEGPEHDALMSLAAQLGVADSVGTGGIALTDRLAMANQVRRASVVALLSEGEGQPLTMLEAAALGRPLVVTDAPGLRELIDKGMALGVPLRASSRQIADAILMQLDQPLIPNRAAVPTWAECVDALVDIYGAASGLPGSTGDTNRRNSYD